MLLYLVYKIKGEEKVVFTDIRNIEILSKTFKFDRVGILNYDEHGIECMSIPHEIANEQEERYNDTRDIILIKGKIKYER